MAAQNEPVATLTAARQVPIYPPGPMPRRLMVRLRTLTPLIVVRIHAGHPAFPPHGQRYGRSRQFFTRYPPASAPASPLRLLPPLAHRSTPTTPPTAHPPVQPQ